MNQTFVSQIKLVAAALWTFVVMWFFVRSFPFRNLLEVILNGWMLVILLFFFTALGTRIIRYFNLSFPSLAQEWSFACGIGSGLIIFLMIGLAVLQILYELVVVCLIIFLFILVYQDIRSLGLRVYSLSRVLSIRRWSLVELGLLFLMGLAGITTFFAAATPPFFYDALVYHLAVPQQYLLAHGFRYMPYHHFSNFPMNLGMLFMVGMSFSGGILAKLISWGFAPMTALAVYGFAKPRWGRRIGLLAAAILFLVPGVLILSTLTSVDLGVMFYSFLSFSALLSWFTLRQKSWFVLAGIFCGLAVGTKYTALLMTFGTILLILISHEYLFARRRRLVTTIRTLVLFGLLVLCVVSPWLIKNVLYTGNPIYPLFNSLMGTRVADQYTFYDERFSAVNPVTSLVNSIETGNNFSPDKWFHFIWQYLEIPWRVTMTNVRAAGKAGALFLICLPLVFLIKTIPSPIRYLLALGACSLWLWVFFLPGTALRYAFQIFPPLGLVVAYTLWNLPIVAQRKCWVIGGVCILLGYHLLLIFQDFASLRPYRYFTDTPSTEDFLVEHGVNYYPVMRYINTELPSDSLILYVGELRGYYCERPILLATDSHRVDEAIILQQLIRESQNTQQVLHALRLAGVTHILMNLPEMERFATTRLSRNSYFDLRMEKDIQIFEELFSKHFHLLFSKEHVYCYHILYEQEEIQKDPDA